MMMMRMDDVDDDDDDGDDDGQQHNQKLPSKFSAVCSVHSGITSSSFLKSISTSWSQKIRD